MVLFIGCSFKYISIPNCLHRFFLWLLFPQLLLLSNNIIQHHHPSTLAYVNLHFHPFPHRHRHLPTLPASSDILTLIINALPIILVNIFDGYTIHRCTAYCVHRSLVHHHPPRCLIHRCVVRPSSVILSGNHPPPLLPPTLASICHQISYPPPNSVVGSPFHPL